MTKRQALQILFNAASAHAAGAGVGIRNVASEVDRLHIAKAVMRLWLEVYDYNPSPSDFMNMGLPFPSEEK